MHRKCIYFVQFVSIKVSLLGDTACIERGIARSSAIKRWRVRYWSGRRRGAVGSSDAVLRSIDGSKKRRNEVKEGDDPINMNCPSSILFSPLLLSSRFFSRQRSSIQIPPSTGHPRQLVMSLSKRVRESLRPLVSACVTQRLGEKYALSLARKMACAALIYCLSCPQARPCLSAIPIRRSNQHYRI